MIERIHPELPNLQCPISLIIDDPTPIFSDRISEEELECRRESEKGVDRWTFFDDLIQLFKDYDVKGKFTLNSYTSHSGMIDMITDPVKKKQLDNFLIVLKKHIVPEFDITPEIISHDEVIDIETGEPLGIEDPEHIWSQTQDEDTLERYIGRGLMALKNVGLECNGVTSPSNFGNKNQENYVRAISRALKRVNNVDLAWYFLDSGGKHYNTPRLMYLNRAGEQAVVSIVPTYRLGDIGLTKKYGDDIAKQADEHITEDGKSGVFPAMIAAKGYIVIYKHWGLLYDSGKETGIKVLRVVLDRMIKHYRDDVQWMKSSAITRYYAVARTCRTTWSSESDRVSIEFESPFTCRDYTISFHTSKNLDKIAIRRERGALRKITNRPKRLESCSWFEEDGLVYVCFNLDTYTQMDVIFDN